MTFETELDGSVIEFLELFLFVFILIKFCKKNLNKKHKESAQLLKATFDI